MLNTNTLISRLLTPGGVPARAVDRALTSGTLLVSKETMNEPARVLDRPKFDPYVTREERQRFIKLLGGVARMVPIVREAHVCRDPKDDMFLDVALNGEAEAIITGVVGQAANERPEADALDPTLHGPAARGHDDVSGMCGRFGVHGPLS